MKGGDALMMRVSNALGVLILIGIMAFTPLIPQVGMSAQPPQWVWDEDGHVHDATGQFRSLTDAEVAAQFGVSHPVEVKYAPFNGEAFADSGGGSR
jgi:hypothetical protein